MKQVFRLVPLLLYSIALVAAAAPLVAGDIEGPLERHARAASETERFYARCRVIGAFASDLQKARMVGESKIDLERIGRRVAGQIGFDLVVRVFKYTEDSVPDIVGADLRSACEYRTL